MPKVVEGPRSRPLEALAGPSRELVELGSASERRIELQPKSAVELETELASLDREIYTLNRRRRQAAQELAVLRPAS